MKKCLLVTLMGISASAVADVPGARQGTGLIFNDYHGYEETQQTGSVTDVSLSPGNVVQIKGDKIALNVQFGDKAEEAKAFLNGILKTKKSYQFLITPQQHFSQQSINIPYDAYNGFRVLDPTTGMRLYPWQFMSSLKDETLPPSPSATSRFRGILSSAFHNFTGGFFRRDGSAGNANDALDGKVAATAPGALKAEDAAAPEDARASGLR